MRAGAVRAFDDPRVLVPRFYAVSRTRVVGTAPSGGGPTGPNRRSGALAVVMGAGAIRVALTVNRDAAAVNGWIASAVCTLGISPRLSRGRSKVCGRL